LSDNYTSTYNDKQDNVTLNRRLNWHNCKHIFLKMQKTDLSPLSTDVFNFLHRSTRNVRCQQNLNNFSLAALLSEKSSRNLLNIIHFWPGPD